MYLGEAPEHENSDEPDEEAEEEPDEEPEEEPTYISPYLDAAGEPTLRIWRLADGSTHRLSYTNGLTFWVNSEDGVIWGKWNADASVADAFGYLLGPALGIFLRLRGETCLHASAVAFEDRAVIFAGPPRAGKSTTAAAFTLRGHAAISDDIVLIKQDATEKGAGCFRATPSHPLLSLWPESLALMGLRADELQRVFPKFDKRRLPLPDSERRFESRSLPIGAIYLLGERNLDSGPAVEEISPQAALISLVADTYATYSLDQARRAKELETLGRLVGRVPIRSARGRETAEGLAEFCDLIEKDYAGQK